MFFNSTLILFHQGKRQETAFVLEFKLRSLVTIPIQDDQTVYLINFWNFKIFYKQTQLSKMSDNLKEFSLIIQ